MTKTLGEKLARRWRDPSAVFFDELSPSTRRARALYWLAQGRRRSGDERAEAYRRAEAADPTYARPATFLGYHLLKSNPREAAAAFTRSLQWTPTESARLGLARALCALGEIEELTRVVDEAVAHREASAAFVALLVEVVDDDVLRARYETLTRYFEDGDAASVQLLLRIASRLDDTAGAKRHAARLRAMGTNGHSLRELVVELADAEETTLVVDNLAGYWRSREKKPRAPRGEASAGEAIDVIAHLGAIERTYPVDRWTIDGVHVWPMVRGAIGFGRLAAARGQATFDREAKTAWRRRIGDLRGLTPRELAPADVVFFGTASQRVEVDDVWMDQLFDPLVDVLEARGATSVHFEYRSDGQRYRTPQLRPSLRIRPHLEGLVKSAPRGPTWDVSMEGFEALAADEPAARNVAFYALKVHQLLRIADVFERYLVRLKPRCVVINCYFGTLGWSLLLAARRLSIPTVDLQHGVTSGHPMYEGLTRHPPRGYQLLPDTFWSWSEEDRDRITAWGGRAVTGGHPWVTFCTDRPTPDALPRGDFNVLLSLNWASGFDRRLEALIQNSPPEWTWWVRLHPKMLDQLDEIRLRCGGHPRVFVEVPTQLPLPVVLRAADVHLTLSSTVTQEAARLGVPTVTLDARTKLIYAAEMNAGWARYADDDVIAAIRAQVAAAKGRTPMRPYPGRDAMSDAFDILLP